MRPKKADKREIVISFRLDLDSDAGHIFEKYRKQGYERSELMIGALLAADGALPHVDSMDEITLDQLKQAIDRLESLALTVSQGAPLTQHQREEVRETLNPQFVESMKRAARPAFRFDPK